MARDKDEEDIYDEEFDFVDDDDFDEDDTDEEAEEEEVAKKPKKAAPRKSAKSPKKKAKKAAPRKQSSRKAAEEESETKEPEFSEVEAEEESADESEAEESLDEFGRPAPVANYVVHVYEHRKFKRTIDRDFTPEDAEAFATDYNRYARAYGRISVAGKKDVPPKKSVEMFAQRNAQSAGDSTPY